MTDMRENSERSVKREGKKFVSREFFCGFFLWRFVVFIFSVFISVKVKLRNEWLHGGKNWDGFWPGMCHIRFVFGPTPHNPLMSVDVGLRPWEHGVLHFAVTQAVLYKRDGCVVKCGSIENRSKYRLILVVFAFAACTCLLSLQDAHFGQSKTPNPSKSP